MEVRCPSISVRLSKDCCSAFSCDQFSPTKTLSKCMGWRVTASWTAWAGGASSSLRKHSGLCLFLLVKYSFAFPVILALWPRGELGYFVCADPPAGTGMSWPQQEGRECLRSHIWFNISSHFSCFKQKHMGRYLYKQRYLHYTKSIWIALGGEPQSCFQRQTWCLY